MARPSARCSPFQNPLPTSGNELADPSSTEGNDTYTAAPAMSSTLTPAPAPAPAPSLAPGPINTNATGKYWEADLQRIFRIVLEARPFVSNPASQPLVFLERLCHKLLKATFPELYHGKTYMKCYSFCQQCKNHFAAIFLQDRALFRW